MKDLIISLAVDGREKYSERVKGLEQSLSLWQGDVIIHKEFPGWVTPHSRVPYRFKFDLIKNAMSKGYKRVFWLDSTMRLVKNISDLLTGPVTAFDNLGHPLKNYINDRAISNLGIKNLEGVKQVWGGCVFWDFNYQKAKVIFDRAMDQSILGSFNDDNTKRDGFIAHRHDQAVLSWLFHEHEVPLLDYGVIAARKDVTDKTFVQYAD